MYIGIDLVEIEEMAKVLERTPLIKKRLFTPCEIEECEAKCRSVISFAERFAAKEAILKVFGTGLHGVKFLDIEVVAGSPHGPEVRMFRSALDVAQKRNIREIKISISHTRVIAVAFALGLTPVEQN